MNTQDNTLHHAHHYAGAGRHQRQRERETLTVSPPSELDGRISRSGSPVGELV